MLAQGEHGYLLRQPYGQAGFLPAASVGLLLPRLVAAPAPASITLLGEAPAGLPAADVQAQPRWQWQLGRHQGVNFAQGELAADRQWRALAPLLRRSGLILGALILAQTALVCGQWGWYAWQKRSLQQDIRQLVQPWAPQAVAGSSALPMLRAVDRLRLSRGLPARDDAVAAMAQLAAVSGGQLQLAQLRYEAGRLAFVAPTLAPEVAARWREQLAARQWLLSSAQTEQGQREWILTRKP